MSRYKYLVKTIDQFKPQTILEVGTWNGKHAVKMLNAALKHHKKVQYYGYDLFEDFDTPLDEFCPKTPAVYNQVKRLLSKYNATLVRGNTRDTLKNTPPPQNSIDFVWLDGGHSLETINSDWENIQHCIHKDTVILLDDYYQDSAVAENYGCRQLIKSLDKQRWDIDILPESDDIQGGINVVRIIRKESRLQTL